MTQEERANRLDISREIINCCYDVLEYSLMWEDHFAENSVARINTAIDNLRGLKCEQEGIDIMVDLRNAIQQSRKFDLYREEAHEHEA